MPPAPVSAPGENGEGDTHGETPVGVMQSGPRYFFRLVVHRCCPTFLLPRVAPP